MNRFRSCVTAGAGTLLVDHAVLEQLCAQAAAVVADVLSGLRSTADDADDDDAVTDLDRPDGDGGGDIQAAPPLHGIHPTQSLRAATVMFEVAFPVLAHRLAGAGDPARDTLDIGLILHQSIMMRLGVSSVPYVSFLLQRVRRAHQEERQRMARELHDRVAHSIAVAQQQLQLHDVYDGRDPLRARNSLERTAEAMSQALTITRQLSAELHHELGEEPLTCAVANYARSAAPPHVEVRVCDAGDSRAVPTEIGGEVYLMIREAIRNALLHSDTTRLAIDIDVSASLLRASVTDSGRGFDAANVKLAQAGGLTSMRQRAALLGATFRVESPEGGGTTVEVRVPLSGGPGT